MTFSITIDIKLIILIVGNKTWKQIQKL